MPRTPIPKITLLSPAFAGRVLPQTPSPHLPAVLPGAASCRQGPLPARCHGSARLGTAEHRVPRPGQARSAAMARAPVPSSCEPLGASSRGGGFLLPM